MTIRTLRFGAELLPDEPLRQDARYTLGQEDRQQIDNQIRTLQIFASRAHLNGVHATYVKLVGGDGALGDVVCSADGLAGKATVQRATPAALATAGVVVGVLLEAATSGSLALVAIGGVVSPTVTGLDALAGWVRVNASARCEQVTTLGDSDIALGHVDAGGYLTLGIRPSAVAGTSLAAEKFLVDDTTTSLANGRALRSLTATIPIRAAGVVPITLTHEAAAGSVVEVLGLGRAITGGSGGTSGTGLHVAVRIPDSFGAVHEAARVRWQLTSAAPLSFASKLVVSFESGELGQVDKLTITSNGLLVLHSYAAVGRLATDAIGNVTTSAITFDEVSAALAVASAAIDVGGQRITNLATPSLAGDAATKEYVDTPPVFAIPTSSGNAVTLDLSVSVNQYHVLTENTTVTITGAAEGMSGVLVFKQDNPAYTVTMPGTVLYDDAIAALGLTAIVKVTVNYYTLLAYRVLPGGQVFVHTRAIAV
jgi:hypothetical protein